MRTVRLTIVLIAATMLISVAVSPVRRALIAAYRSGPYSHAGSLPTKLQYERAALAHPNRPEIWLGFAQAVDDPLTDVWLAQVPNWGKESSWTAARAYDRAISIAPDSPAPYLRYALYLLARSGSLGRIEEWHGNRQKEPQRTAREARDLHRAARLLKQARKLEPENAACDYLLAYIYLALHEDDQASAALAARDKPRWNIANAEATTGLLRLMDATDMPEVLVPTVVPAVYAVGEFGFYSHLKSLAQTLVGIGEKLKAEGKHQEAITYYEATIHLGHVMRVDAYSMIEGLVGVAITSIAAGPFVSEAEEQEIQRAAASGEETGKRIRKVRMQHLAGYLKRHGRPGLAQFYQAEMQSANQWRDTIRASIGRGLAELILAFWGGTARYAWAVWAATGAFAALWILVGLLSVIARYWREEALRLPWTYLNWGLLLAVAVAGVFTVALWPKPRIISDQVSTQFVVAHEGILASVGIAVIGWLVAGLVITLRRRATLPAEQRVGKARTYLASLRMLLPPTFAAFLLVGVVALWPVHQNMQRWADQQRTIIEQGEVQYWNIGGESGPDYSRAAEETGQLQPYRSRFHDAFKNLGECSKAMCGAIPKTVLKS